MKTTYKGVNKEYLINRVKSYIRQGKLSKEAVYWPAVERKYGIVESITKGYDDPYALETEVGIPAQYGYILQYLYKVLPTSTFNKYLIDFLEDIEPGTMLLGDVQFSTKFRLFTFLLHTFRRRIYQNNQEPKHVIITTFIDQCFDILHKTDDPIPVRVQNASRHIETRITKGFGFQPDTVKLAEALGRIADMHSTQWVRLLKDFQLRHDDLSMMMSIIKPKGCPE